MPNLHPVLVHFTIALYTTSIIFDLIGFFAKNKSLTTVGRWNLLVATLFAIPAVITGLIAASTLPHTDQIHEIMETHETLGLIVLSVAIVLSLWRLFNRGALPVKPFGLYLLIGLGGLGVLVAGGYYGGEMVYAYGMGVKPMMAEMSHEHHHHDHEGGEDMDHEHDLSEHDIQYTCPMHPEVISDKPGTCPVCGMALQEITETEGHDEAEHHEMHESENDHHDETEHTH